MLVTAKTALLQALMQGEGYGIDLIERLKKRSVNISQGSIYPALRELESDGLLASREQDPDPERGGRPRVYYHLTKRGMEQAKKDKEVLLGILEADEQYLTSGLDATKLAILEKEATTAEGRAKLFASAAMPAKLSLEIGGSGYILLGVERGVESIRNSLSFMVWLRPRLKGDEKLSSGDLERFDFVIQNLRVLALGLMAESRLKNRSAPNE